MAKRTTALANYDEELARQAAAVVEQEASAIAGSFFSIKGGQLQFNGAAVPNNQMAVVIADSMLENVLYEGEYDPDNISGPSCYAFGFRDGDMKPHEEVEEAQSNHCVSCESNQWGSGRGRGKACRNTRRLGLISAGLLDASGKFVPQEDADELGLSVLAFMRLPVTSVKAFGQYVHTLANIFKRPPHAVYTKLCVVPDDKTLFKVTFEPLGNVPKKLLPVVMKRHEDARTAINFPYPKIEDDGGKKKAKPRGKGVRAKSTRKKVTKKKTTKKGGQRQRF